MPIENNPVKTVSGAQLQALLAKPGQPGDVLAHLSDASGLVAMSSPRVLSVTHQPIVALVFDRYGTRPKCAKIVRGDGEADNMPSVLMLVEQADGRNRWIAEPFLFRREYREEPHVAVMVAETWVTVLLAAVEEEYAALAPSVPRNAAVTHVVRAQMFEEQIRKFRLQGPKEFFKEHTRARRWVIALHWHDWIEDDTGWDERQEELRHAGYAMGKTPLIKFCSGLGLKRRD